MSGSGGLRKVAARALGGALSIGLLVVALEFGTRLVFHRVTGMDFDRPRLRGSLLEGQNAEGLDAIAPGEFGRHFANREVHPYLGFTYSQKRPGINAHGFEGPSALAPKPEGTLRVAIFGLFRKASDR